MPEQLATNGAGPGTPLADVEAAEITEAQLLSWYREMTLIRRVEELAAKAYTLRKIKGFCHLYIGQEAVCVGASAALEPGDTVAGSYRDHGQIMSRGVSARAMLAELFGKATGVTNGVGGSMHLASKEHDFIGGYGIVGGHVPLGAGAAFANKYKDNGKVSLTYFGDGAAHQGAFFEAMALSQLWQLPAVYLCENNGYAMGTSLERQSYLTDMSRRGDGVGMLRWQFNGLDIVDVYQNVKKAVDYARAGKGPVILEAITYRYRGHSMSDPAKYRKKGELKEKKAQDCIESAGNLLQSRFGVTSEALDAIKADVEVESQDAYKFADESDVPDPSKLYDYTYAE